MLDDHVAAIGASLRLAVSATAVRTGSVDARHLLARAALSSGAGLDDLLAAARRKDRRWLRGQRPQRAMLAALAQTIALQDRLPSDRADALALYTLVGADALSAAHQGLHAQLTLAWAGPAAVPGLLASYRRMRPDVRAALEVDLRNPFVAERPVEPWLAAFQALLPEPGLTLMSSTTLSPFDRLGAPPIEPVNGPHRITVVVTAYRPGDGLITAVRSILAQTWRDVDVVIVDDGSPREHDAVLRRAAAMGDRVRLIRQPSNAGTYAARNAGLEAAGGEFVTFQDSDDWSHPRRLERQVAPLIADDERVASTSDGLSVTEDLLLTRAGVRTGRFNPSSMMFRRVAVVERIGWFDRLRKAADSEYLGRIEAAFGASAVHHVAEPLALIRLTANSLSRAEIRPHWMHPARAAYRSAYQRWHEAIAAGAADPHRPADGRDRPFAAPAHLAGARNETSYDVVLAGDWRYATGPVRSAVDEIRALVAAGMRVGIVQLDAFRAAHRRRQPLCGAIQDLVNSGVADHAHLTDPCTAELLLVRQAAVLQFAADEPAMLRAGRVLVVADRAPAGHYDTRTCTARVRQVFDLTAVWWPRDPGVREALRSADPDLPLAERDLPAVVDAAGWVATRAGATAELPIAGADLCDTEAAGPLGALAGLSGVDIRLRLADGSPDAPAPGVPHSWLVFPAGAVAPKAFLHQLDFYLHVPDPAAAGTFSRPALEAAAAGCVVVLPERSAALYGDAAVYAEPDAVPDLIHRYAADRALFAEQSRRAREVVAKAHRPEQFAEAVELTVGGIR